jgi:hypothetical protein
VLSGALKESSSPTVVMASIASSMDDEAAAEAAAEDEEEEEDEDEDEEEPMSTDGPSPAIPSKGWRLPPLIPIACRSACWPPAPDAPDAVDAPLVLLYVPTRVWGRRWDVEEEEVEETECPDAAAAATDAAMAAGLRSWRRLPCPRSPASAWRIAR